MRPEAKDHTIFRHYGFDDSGYDRTSAQHEAAKKKEEGKNKGKTSTRKGRGALLMDAIVQGDVPYILKRVECNEDPVFNEHLKAMELRVRGVQEKIELDKFKCGEDSSLGRQLLEQRLGEFNGALCLLGEKCLGESDPDFDFALSFLQRNNNLQRRRAQR